MGSLKSKILSGVFWQGLEKVGSQGINFAIQIILARLLAPKDFGVLVLMMVFINLCNVGYLPRSWELADLNDV